MEERPLSVPGGKNRKRIRCGDCGGLLGDTETALNLKLRGRAVGVFYCLNCLAARTGAEAGELAEMAEFFRANGCELFARHYVDEPGRDEE